MGLIKDILKVGGEAVAITSLVLAIGCGSNTPTSESIKNYKSQKEFKTAFVLLAKDEVDLTENREKILNELKENFEISFSNATFGAGSMDTSYSVRIVVDKDNNMDSEDGFLQPWNATKEFYKNNPDEFDFIAVYPTKDFNNNGSYFHNVKNNIEGIGLNTFDSTTYYGSKGKLQGVAVIKDYEIKEDLDEIIHLDGDMNLLLHEIGHNWGVYVGDNFAASDERLGIKEQGIHFYSGLESPYENDTPMNSNIWVPNGDGTFTHESPYMQEKYHPFQLYLMGLCTKNSCDYSKQFNVYNAGGGDSGQFYDWQKAVPFKTISIEDIITVEGERYTIN